MHCVKFFHSFTLIKVFKDKNRSNIRFFFTKRNISRILRKISYILTVNVKPIVVHFSRIDPFASLRKKNKPRMATVGSARQIYKCIVYHEVFRYLYIREKNGKSNTKKFSICLLKIIPVYAKGSRANFLAF